MQLIGKYSSLFSDVPTVTNVLEHDIDVGDHHPVKQNAYRINPVKREIMKKETQYLIQHGLAVPSSSPWCSPCLLVPKPDGTSRFCTDYLKVNQLTKSDSFPLPRIDDCVDRIGQAKFVTCLRGIGRYHSLIVPPKSLLLLLQMFSCNTRFLFSD